MYTSRLAHQRSQLSRIFAQQELRRFAESDAATCYALAS